jgi:hypothetical protein
MLTTEQVTRIVQDLWASRDPHVHLMRLSITTEDLPLNFRVDVGTDTRDGHFEIRPEVSVAVFVRSGRHKKPGRLDVDHLPPSHWGLHEKHLYFTGSWDEVAVHGLLLKGLTLLEGMALQTPDDEAHAAVDKSAEAVVATEGLQWRELWCRVV